MTRHNLHCLIIILLSSCLQDRQKKDIKLPINHIQNEMEQSIISRWEKKFNSIHGKKTHKNIEFSLNKQGLIASLRLKNVPLKKIYNDISRFKYLEELSIHFPISSEEKLPDISTFKELKVLDLTGFHFKKKVAIPESYNKLKILDLFSCGIKTISFPKNSKLEILNLGNNRISNFDNTLQELKSLWRLHLTSNKIRNLDLKGLGKLELLDLVDNPIKNESLIKNRPKNLKVVFSPSSSKSSKK